MNKKVIGVFVFIMMLVLMPTNVMAETNALVKVRKDGFGMNATIIAEIPVEKEVTTVGDIREILVNDYDIDFDTYVIVDMSFDPIPDTTTICSQELSCYGPINEPFTYIDLIEVDSTKISVNINSILPKDEMMFESIYETNWELFDGIGYKSCDDEFKICTFVDYGNYKIYDNVVINYIYNDSIRLLAETVVSSGLLNRTSFTLTDTEFLNYINYGGILADYSSDFKNQLSNLNFKFDMDVRGGGWDPFGTEQIGFYKFLYNNTLYAVKDFMKVSFEHIIYVPTDTTDVVKAIEDRLETLFGDNVNIRVSESEDTINEYLVSENYDPIDDGDQKYYILTVTDEDSELYDMEFNFIAVKDSSKIDNSVSFKSKDLVTNVSVATDSNVPLDALVNVSELTSGTQYNKIMGILNITDGEMFDIGLYSNSQNRSVTKLDNGKFLVSIPIPQKFNGKNLIIYYVDDDDNIEEHEVTVKNGYAEFETDHFSIYTLASVSSNPQTGNNVILYIIILVVCVAVIGVIIYLSKKKK